MPHILLPTDFSDASLNAVRFALHHFGGARSRFTLVHAYLGPSTDGMVLDIPAMVRRQAVKGVRGFERRLKRLGMQTAFAHRVSPEWLPEALNGIADEQGADLVVMGAHGAGGNPLLGNASLEVVQNAQLPVVLVPRTWEPGPIKRIMLAHDGGVLEAAPLAPLRQLARRKKAEVIVAHVRNNSIAMDRAMDRRLIKELLAGVPVSFVTAQGDSVARTIDELATDGRIQLVAAVHRRRGFWSGLLHRSKAKRMALHTHVPLLVLR